MRDENGLDEYIRHFQKFGYSESELRETWANLSERARENYRTLLSERR